MKTRLHSRDERGQATVELALAIPLLAAIFLVVAQVGVVMLDQLAVESAAREAVRVAAVQPGEAPAAAAAREATRLDPALVKVKVEPAGQSVVRVTVTYRSSVRVPWSGRVLLQPEVSSTAVMRSEQ